MTRCSGREGEAGEAGEEERLCIPLQCGQSGEVRVGSPGGWAGTRWGRDLDVVLKTGHCHELTRRPVFQQRTTGHPVFKGSGRVGFPPPPTAFLSSCHHPTAGPESWGSLRFLPPHLLSSNSSQVHPSHFPRLPSTCLLPSQPLPSQNHHISCLNSCNHRSLDLPASTHASQVPLCTR